MKLSRFMLLIWLPIHLLLSGCCQTVADSADGLAEIDIVNSLGKYHAIPVSEFVTELEYIPLETGNDCLIARVENVIVTSTHIFITSRNRCYAFDRVGRFIRQIGGIGQGPGEYTNLSGISIDEINRSLYLETPRNLLEYSWDGGFRRSIQKPVQNEFHAEKTVFVRDGVFIGHYPNPYGNDMYHYQLFNESGQVVKSFDNPVRFEPA